MSSQTAYAALVDESGSVLSVTVVDPDGTYRPPDGLTAHILDEGSPVGPGWIHHDGQWIEPIRVNPEPEGPSPLALLQAQVDELTDLTMELLMGT